MHTVSSVGVLVIRDKKVLLVRHEEAASHQTGTYGLPSGRVEENETYKQAAVRELHEETGLITSETDLIDYPSNHFFADIKRKNGKTERFSWKVFVCKKYSGQLQPTAEVTPEWIEIVKLHRYRLLPNVREVVEKEVKW
ncbi:MAG: NUDIX domain-containing protein [Candidatus Levybacteria bacterium]|nr:NUDIX domain-containing protein [Candidatus Levybacteria bacterium]